MAKSRDLKTGHWEHFEGLDPAKAVGFVYLIISKSDNTKYIGKKFFRGRGKKNKGVESDWKTYCSSSTALKAQIKEKGNDDFVFIILEQYYTVGGLSFAETWTQTTCLCPLKNDEFWNRFIDKVSWKVTEPVSDRHQSRLRSALRKYTFKRDLP